MYFILRTLCILCIIQLFSHNHISISRKEDFYAKTPDYSNKCQCGVSPFNTVIRSGFTVIRHQINVNRYSISIASFKMRAFSIEIASIYLDLPQVDLFLFITLERSEKVISSDEIARARASASDLSRKGETSRLGKIIGKDF